MIAYCVHDEKKLCDLIVLPNMACAVPVNTENMQKFISPAPVFAEWSGDSCVDLSPEAFGTVMATRDEDGDVCVLKPELWEKAMEKYLGVIKPGSAAGS
jgi:hypothetical protein